VAITIAVDAMGGDHGMPVTVPASMDALANNPGLRLILVGKEPLLRRALRPFRHTPEWERVIIHHASEVVAMDESPAVALRARKKTSMRLAIELVRDGTAQACVSAGNTGALMAIARFILKMLPNIDRPAIATIIPNRKDFSYMLDLGANVSCDAKHLVQFAVMGAMLMTAATGKQTPSVGLLNVGHEMIKGHESVREAAEILQKSPLNFHGFIEGDDIYKGTTDVIVCDGFVGNVTLKASEGLSAMIESILRQEFKRSFWTKLGGLLAQPVMRSFQKRVDYRRYNGATLVGLRGIVVKSHGSADRFAYFCAIERALREVSYDTLGRINSTMKEMPVPALV
jgi:glycerol-3-phosphate acyltransferase PlsX